MQTEYSTLYKIDSKGKIRQWSIYIEGNSYWTVTGIYNGKLITNRPVAVEGKNTGRANETTPEGQALSEAEAKVTKQKESGYYENIDDIKKGKEYFEPMTAQPYKKYKDSLVLPVFVQPKLDGIRCIIRLEDGKLVARSRKGKVFDNLKHVLDELLVVFKHNENLILDGELYNHELRHDFNKIASLVKKQGPKDGATQKKIDEWERYQWESEQLIRYHVYDCAFPGTVTTNLNPPTFAARFSNLKHACKQLKYTKIVETEKVNSFKDLDDIYDLYLQQGYEGQMIRTDSYYVNKRTKDLLKRKEFFDEEYEILKVIEGTGNRAGMAGAVLIKCTEHPDGEVKSNIKGPRTFLTEVWNDKKNIVGKLATVQFPNKTPDGAPRFPYVIAIRDYEG